MEFQYYIFDSEKEEKLDDESSHGLTRDEAIRRLGVIDEKSPIKWDDDDTPVVYAVSYQEEYGQPVEYLYHDSRPLEIITVPSRSIWDEVHTLIAGALDE